MRIIAGPCQHETVEMSVKIAQQCQNICNSYGFDYYFKASFDKANRTTVNGERGLGIHATIAQFEEIKRTPGLEELKIVTDVHEIHHVKTIEAFGDLISVIQIPAFLCRQTDLILEACKTDKIVNIKKGQFLAPWDIEGILSKTDNAKEIWITERGTSFGYNNLVVDFTGLDYMLNQYSDRAEIVFDATHSVQKPGGLGTSTGGNRDYVPGLTRAASALGIKNFFMEVHPDPNNAPSDGPNSLYLDDFEQVVEDIARLQY